MTRRAFSVYRSNMSPLPAKVSGQRVSDKPHTLEKPFRPIHHCALKIPTKLCWVAQVATPGDCRGTVSGGHCGGGVNSRAKDIRDLQDRKRTRLNSRPL